MTAKDKDCSLDALVKFLDYAGEKGLIKPNTARSRRIAATKVLSLLEDNEKNDLKSVDIEHAFERFANLEGQSYNPSSLKIYKSRLRLALKDFFSYVEDPVSFRPTGVQRATSNQKKKNENNSFENKAENNNRVQSKTEVSNNTESIQKLVIPVPLRERLTVEIHNIPPDLTEGESEKISAIIKAYTMK